MPARLATLEELVGHPLEAGKDYCLTLPSEVQSVLKSGYLMMETFTGTNGEPFVLMWRKPQFSEVN